MSSSFRSGSLDAVLAYHTRTKHHPFRFAASLGYMDWATQPDPFRRYEGAPQLPLDLLERSERPRLREAFTPGRVPPARPDRAAISRLFHDALALSAWKQAGQARWALRVNPSSGNLHPTESYLIAGDVAGLTARPAIFHYAPFPHALELRAELPEGAWRALAEQLPHGAVLVALTSIHWRESWKYGERAFRYCQHDAGHAIASVAGAAGGLGWTAALLESVTDADIELLAGIDRQTGIEAEHADCLLAVYPGDRVLTSQARQRVAVPDAVQQAAVGVHWQGEPNRLSRDHHRWPVIEEVAAATERIAPPPAGFWSDPPASPVDLPDDGPPLRSIVHQRRSAVAFDGRTALAREAWFTMLDSTMPRERLPFAALPWRPCVDLLLFVHRVEDVAPGLYCLLRDDRRRGSLQEAMTRPFRWETPPGCPSTLPLFLLEEGDARAIAQQTSCDQEIAADGAFAVAMLAEFRTPIQTFGPWFYRRLHWETGAIGQVLYLEAEAHGVRGTGIGCFFDDLTHRVFGLEDDRFQVLYHFTVGGPVEDTRLQTLGPYDHLHR